MNHKLKSILSAARQVRATVPLVTLALVAAAIPTAAPAGAAVASWPQFMSGPAHTSFISTSSGPSASNASLLVPAWIDHDTGSNGHYGSSPAVNGSSVYIGDEAGQLTKRSTSNGAINWTFRTANAIYVTPAIGAVTVNGTRMTMVFVADLSGNVYGVNDSTGTKVWLSGATSDVLAAPTLVGNVLYTVSNDGTVDAWNAATGTRMWHTTPDTGAPNPLIESSPTVSGGNIYVGDYSGNLYGLSTKTGAATLLASFNSSVGGQIPSTIATDGRYLYFEVNYQLATPARLHAVKFDTQTASVVWDVTLGDTLFGGGAGYDIPSPAITPTHVLFPTAFMITALDPSSGSPDYATKALAQLEPTTPAVANGVFYVAGIGGASIQAFDETTGQPLFFAATPSVADTTVAVSGGRIFFGIGNGSGAQDGALYAYQLSANK